MKDETKYLSLNAMFLLVALQEQYEALEYKPEVKIDSIKSTVFDELHRHGFISAEDEDGFVELTTIGEIKAKQLLEDVFTYTR